MLGIGGVALVFGQSAPPASIAGLPRYSARVIVSAVPGFDASGASIGSSSLQVWPAGQLLSTVQWVDVVTLHVPVLSPVPVKPHVLPVSRLCPPEVRTPKLLQLLLPVPVAPPANPTMTYLNVASLIPL